jgi:acyl carrier protein
MDAHTRNTLVSEYFQKITGQANLDAGVNVFETGLVNSLATIQLIAFLEKSFKFKVGVDDLDIANFCSIEAVCNFLDKKAAGNA